MPWETRFGVISRVSACRFVVIRYLCNYYSCSFLIFALFSCFLRPAGVLAQLGICLALSVLPRVPPLPISSTCLRLSVCASLCLSVPLCASLCLSVPLCLLHRLGQVLSRPQAPTIPARQPHEP